MRRASSRSEPRVEVEPLSEARWGRIEDALFARIDREERATLTPLHGAPQTRSWPARPRVQLAAALLVGAAAAMAGLHLRAPGGTVGASRITTGASESHVAIGEAALDVGPESALRVSGDDDRGVLVELDHGDVDFEVAPRKQRPPFVVEAGDVRVRVVGTRFRVHRAPGPGVRVEVAHGIVEVTSHGETVRVGAGESWPARPAAHEPAAAATAERSADPAAAQADDPTMELDDELDDVPLTASAPSGRASTHASHGARRRAAHGKARLRAAQVDVAASTVPDNAGTPIAEPGAAPPAERAAEPPPSPTLQERYESAARIERTRPEAALSVYRDLARGDGAWASNALFAAARLQAERGARTEAARLLAEYLQRFPSGPNAGDARVLQARLR